MSSHPPPGASVEDPTAPCPVGPTMQPAVGVPLESRQDWHRNLEAAIQHHSSTLTKSPAISTVDLHGKVSVAVTYGEGVVCCVYIKYGVGRSMHNYNIYSTCTVPVRCIACTVGPLYMYVCNVHYKNRSCMHCTSSINTMCGVFSCGAWEHYSSRSCNES